MQQVDGELFAFIMADISNQAFGHWHQKTHGISYRRLYKHRPRHAKALEIRKLPAPPQRATFCIGLFSKRGMPDNFEPKYHL